MICVSCGHCCKTMSPINGGYCPLLVKEEDIYYCSDYENRPKECRDHDYNSRVCPVGVNTLNLINDKMIQDRMEKVWGVIGQPRPEW